MYKQNLLIHLRNSINPLHCVHAYCSNKKYDIKFMHLLKTRTQHNKTHYISCKYTLFILK